MNTFRSSFILKKTRKNLPAFSLTIPQGYFRHPNQTGIFIPLCSFIFNGQGVPSIIQILVRLRYSS